MQTFLEAPDLLPLTEKMWLRKRKPRPKEHNRRIRSSYFLRFRECVIQESLDDALFAVTLGMRRERIALNALRILKGQGKIAHIVPTVKFSWADLIEDIDIYAVYPANGRLAVAKFSVGGPHDSVERILKHPDNVVLTISGTESEREVADIIAGILGI